MKKNQTTVVAIKAFNDNYIWAIHSKDNSCVALVDPGDAQVCIKYLQDNHLTLSAILITHHHADHTGGIAKLREFAQQNGQVLTVYGPAHDNIAQLDVLLEDHAVISIDSLPITLQVKHLPGHTTGHIAYVNQEYLFCGDTLFSGGCGRLFEGSAEQMYLSLNRLKNLPESTLVFCAHEYTQANLAFALTVEPDNAALTAYHNQVSKLRQQGLSTLPSTIALEKNINPFLRCDNSTIQNSVKKYHEQDNLPEVLSEQITFTGLRAWKDKF